MITIKNKASLYLEIIQHRDTDQHKTGKLYTAVSNSILLANNGKRKFLKTTLSLFKQ